MGTGLPRPYLAWNSDGKSDLFRRSPAEIGRVSMVLRGPSKRGPSLVACIGLPRSASTLAFNAAIKVLAASGRQVKSLYADDAPDVLAAVGQAGSAVVFKGHAPQPALRNLLDLARAPCILTIRDPRDSVCSLMEQFGWMFDQALAFVANSADILGSIASPGALVLRYEEAEDRAATWCAAIAHYLGANLDWDEIDRLGHDLAPDNVRRLIEGYVAEGVLDAANPGFNFHPDSQWHPRHVGDGQVGKFAIRLTQHQAALVYLRTRAFCDLYGYPPSWPPAVDGSLRVMPGEGPSAYLQEGFSSPEGWGAWTDGPRAALFFPLVRPCSSFRFAMSVTASPGFARVPKPRFTVTVNELSFPDLWEPEQGEAMALVVAGTMQTAGSLRVEIVFNGLSSPSPDEQNGDTRTLGLALRRLELDVR